MRLKARLPCRCLPAREETRLARSSSHHCSNRLVVRNVPLCTLHGQPREG